MFRGKKYQDAAKQIEKNTQYDAAEGFGLVFAKGDKAEAAKAAGADYVGEMDLVEKIQKENWFDFDVVVASPDMMGVVGRLGKVLGPKGLMPSPKAGTVTPDVAKAVQESKAGKVEYRLDKTNIIHCPIGKVSFGPEKLMDNYNALMGAIVKARQRQGPVYQVLRRRLHHGPRRQDEHRKDLRKLKEGDAVPPFRFPLSSLRTGVAARSRLSRGIFLTRMSSEKSNWIIFGAHVAANCDLS